jgi:hypothetical protein
MKPNTSKTTILVIAMGLLVLHLLFKWQWAVVASLAIGLVGIFSVRLSKGIEWGWMKLSLVLSYFVPSIILGIIFYLFLFPISLISKLFTRDPLMLSGRHSSYFINHDKAFHKSSMEKPW